MDNPSYIALSRFAILPRQQETIAHNIANAATGGFKSQQMSFAEHVLEQRGITAPPGGRPLAFAYDRATRADFSSGPFTQTGNPLDLALQGEGFLVFDTPQGERYGRNGRLVVGPDRALTNQAGQKVLGQDGQPIVVPANEASITVAADGSVSGSAGAIGRLRVVRFADPQQLVAEGHGLWRSNADPEPAPAPRVIQGMVEESNVQPVVELTRMIEATREFQMVAQFIEREGERQSQAIERLTRRRA